MKRKRPDVRRIAFIRGIAAGWLAAACAVGPAAAGDHRFCLAERADTPDVLISGAFPSDAPLTVLEDAFRTVLAEKLHKTFGVQCPRAPDREAAEAARRHAERYLASNGRRPIPFDWKP